MEREANYGAVGAFVILVTVMAGLFVYWYSEGRDRRSYTNYEIYFPGSVTGLSEGGRCATWAWKWARCGVSSSTAAVPTGCR